MSVDTVFDLPITEAADHLIFIMPVGSSHGMRSTDVIRADLHAELLLADFDDIGVSIVGVCNRNVVKTKAVASVVLLQLL